MQKNVMYRLIVVAICLLISACGPSQAKQDAQATQIINDFYATQTAAPTATATSTPTPTLTPTATQMPSPTPIPGVFLNRPAYLQELFLNTDWVWIDHSIGATVGTLQYNASTQFLLVYGTDETTANDLLISGRFDIDPEDRVEDVDFFYEFLSILLQEFLHVSTSEQLVQYIADNKELEVYETKIDGFSIYLSLEDDSTKNIHSFFLIIDEKVDE
jgi:hypothetical protein